MVVKVMVHGGGGAVERRESEGGDVFVLVVTSSISYRAKLP